MNILNVIKHIYDRTLNELDTFESELTTIERLVGDHIFESLSNLSNAIIDDLNGDDLVECERELESNDDNDIEMAQNEFESSSDDESQEIKVNINILYMNYLND